MCRYINADAFISTGQGLVGNNMFAYCGNNSPLFSDPMGTAFATPDGTYGKWNSSKPNAPISGNRPANVGSAPKSFFGAKSSVVMQEQKEVYILPDPLPITIKNGERVNIVLFNSGSDTNPISVYAQGRADNAILSSAGIKFNGNDNSTVAFTLGIDNLSLSSSMRNSNTVSSFSLTADLTSLKIGFEISETIQCDNLSTTTYTNVSLSGGVILAAAYLLGYGQPPSDVAFGY